ncbi:MAG: hypothetical protein ACK6D0_12695, partial [Planctomyces sp.]
GLKVLLLRHDLDRGVPVPHPVLGLILALDLTPGLLPGLLPAAQIFRVFRGLCVMAGGARTNLFA